MHATSKSEDGSLVVEPPQSLVSAPHPNGPNFVTMASTSHQAKMTRKGTLPVGNANMPKKTMKTSKAKGTGGKKTSRGAKKGIRAVPDYSGDPIEDFDEVDLVKIKGRWLVDDFSPVTGADQ